MDARDRDSILPDLASADDELRRLAVERLGLLPAAEAIPLLVARLGDESWRVRKAAVERLAASGDPLWAGALLVGALGDGENPGRRNAALEALVRCGSSVLPALLAATSSPDPDVRKQVVDALTGIADPGTAARLGELLSDPDANVRSAAADALGAIGRPESAAALLRSVSEESERLVRLSALRALARMERAVDAAALGSALGDSLLRPAALALLGWSDDPEAPELLLKGLATGSRAGGEAAMEALLRLVARLGPTEGDRLAARARETALAAPELVARAVARLEAADLPTRLTLVQFLGLLRSEQVVLPLLRAGRDEALCEVVLATLQSFGPLAEDVLDARFAGLDADERVLACELFGRGATVGARRRLLQALVEPDGLLRAAAARALGRRRDPEALEALVRRFEEEAAEEADGDGEELELLADAIAAIAGRESGRGEDIARRAARLLAERLPEASEAYRSAAARVLGRLGDGEEAGGLGLLLSDPSPGVRRAAVEGLARLARDVLPEPLRLACADEAPAVRIAAAAALARSSDARVLDDLERLAGDEDAAVRGAALRAVGALHSDGEEALARRIALLERGAAEGGPGAMAALEALRGLGDPRAVGVAGRLLGADAPELVRAAAACLGSVGEGHDLELLIPLLGHASWAVRAEAIRVLAERRVRKAVPALLRRLEVEQDDFVRQALLGALERLER
jgi:HEAT repeat protein